MQLMVEGDKWELYIPPALGYGDSGSASIPAGSVLVFQMELLAESHLELIQDSVREENYVCPSCEGRRSFPHGQNLESEARRCK